MKALSLVLTVFISLQSFAVTQAECEQRDGYRWDANLGCLTTQQVQDTREESRECLELEGDELTACQKRVANERAAELNDQHEGSIRSNDGLKYGAALASVIGTGYILLKSKGELSSCGKASVWLMAAGSISALTGEIWSRVRYEKHISQASKSYRNEVDVANNGNVPDDEVSDEEKADQATNTQISAFDYLIRIEEAREKAEKMRRTLYTISATSFAAATLASLYEAVMESTGASLGICKTKNENLINKDLEMEFKTGGNIDASNTPKPNGDVSKYFFFKNTIFENYAHIQNITPNEVYEIILRKISSSFFGDAFAGQSVLPQSMQLLVGTAVSVAGPVVTRNIDNGYFRAAYSGILGTSSLLLRNQADNIIDTSR